MPRGSASRITALASEQERPDIARKRARWKARQGSIDPKRLVFIDETWAKTNMAPLRGWAARGQRLIGRAPFGHWNTMTFVGALRHDGIIAPSPLSLGPCMDGSRVTRGLVIFGNWSGAAMYSASRLRFARAP
jgi:hypothetical protein